MTAVRVGDAVEMADEAEVGKVTVLGSISEKDCSAVEAPDADDLVGAVQVERRINWSSALAFGLLPGVAFVLAVLAGWLTWQYALARGAESSRADSVKAASEATAAILSYQADSVEQDLRSAQARLTGSFKDSYSELTNDVVIPGAKAQQISAVARISAAGSVSATPKHAVVLLFVNQTVVIGKDSPTDTSSVVRVSMDKVGDQWLVSAFEPI